MRIACAVTMCAAALAGAGVPSGPGDRAVEPTVEHGVREVRSPALPSRPLAFMENAGQAGRGAAHVLRARDADVFTSAHGLTYRLHGARGRGWAVKADFEGASPVTPVGTDPIPGVTSFFRGKPSEWRTGLRSFGTVTWREPWPGIDVKTTSADRAVKTEYVVRAGADPSRVRIAYRGAELSLTDDGSLRVSTPEGAFDDLSPIAWQEGPDGPADVPVRYVLETREGGGTVSFALGAFDPSRELVIDPCTYAYAGFLGGSGHDEPHAVAADGVQNAYFCGQTTSGAATFPETVGPDLTPNDLTNATGDAWVAKLDPTGAFVYCSYLGGTSDDFAYGIAADGSGNAYVVGLTRSQAGGFPTLTGPSLTPGDAGGNVNGDGFVTKINAGGTGLVYSGFVPGNGVDTLYSVAVDSGGSAYVCGSTTSTNVVVNGGRSGSSLTSLSGSNGLIGRVTADGTGFTFLGYFGGAGFGDECRAIAIDGSGNCYVVGSANASESDGFPVLTGPDLTFNDTSGNTDAYVAKFTSSGAAVACGYLGGTEIDEGTAIAVDGSGRVYVGGATESTQESFPALTGPDLTANGLRDGFVARVKADFSGLDFCGFVGSTGFDRVTGVALDSEGDLRFCGWGVTSTGLPAPAGYPAFPRQDVVNDGFYGTISSATAQVTQFSFFGDATESSATGIATSSDGSVYLCGWHSGNADLTGQFPTEGPVDASPNGSFDALVLRIPGIPDAPTMTSVTVNGVTSIDVVFQDNSTNEVGFVLERTSPDGGDDLNIPLGVNPGTGAVTYNDAAILPDTTYVYRVKAVGYCVDTAFSTTLQGATGATMDFVVGKGALSDSTRAGKDKFKAKGTYTYRGNSPDSAFDRATDAVRLAVGSAGARIVIAIPAASTWKVNGKGIETWRSAKGAAPAVKFSIHQSAGTFSISVKKGTYGGAVANPIGFIFKARNDAGRESKEWRQLKPGKFKTP
ncbi:MAG: hypothetical protein HMLKMBBP_03070 [Planctomycetes bacterium]|nr:hypothetical protein [Planctomycetota bacterium]